MNALHWLDHWAYRDLWVPLWPNMFSPSGPSLLAVLWHHRRLKTHITAAAAAGPAGHCPGCTCEGGHW